LIPDSSNFFASLHTTRSRGQVAGLFAPPTWIVRKCGWTDYEVRSPFAELVIEAESPILCHGSVAGVEATAERILAMWRASEIAYSAECYDAVGELVRKWEWEAT
jgi:hypothetical protein